MDFLNPKTILVVQIGKIGDMILTTPLFTELKKLFPEAALKVLATNTNKDIPLNHSAVDEVKIFRKNFLLNILLPDHALRKIDLWIDTKDCFSRTSAMLEKTSYPVHSLGFNFKNKIFGVALNEYVNGFHAVDINLSPLNYLKSEKIEAKIKPSFNIPVEVERKFNNYFQDKLNILINISAGNAGRYLENEKWISIINNINSIKFSSISLIGLKKDKKIIDDIINNLNYDNAKYIETGNILEVAEIVRRNDIVITPDTSIVHLCSAFNTPVVGLYPNVEWNLKKFGPLSDQNEMIISKDENSIKDIKASEVVKSIRGLLARR